MALACILLSLTSCASKPAVRTETVEVAVPVIVAVPGDLTEVSAEPVLPDGEIVNDDLVEYIEALRAWGRGLAGKLREIDGLAPGGDDENASE